MKVLDARRKLRHCLVLMAAIVCQYQQCACLSLTKLAVDNVDVGSSLNKNADTGLRWLEKRQVSLDDLIHTAMQIVRPIFDTSQPIQLESPTIPKRITSEQSSGIRESNILGAPVYSSARDVPICRGNSQICKFIACTAHNFKYDQNFSNLNLAAQLINDHEFRKTISKNPEAVITVCREQGLSAEQCRIFSRAFQLLDKFMNTIEPEDKKTGESAEENDELIRVDGDINRNVLQPMDDDAMMIMRNGLEMTSTTVFTHIPMMTPIRPVNHPEILRDVEKSASVASSSAGTTTSSTKMTTPPNRTTMLDTAVTSPTIVASSTTTTIGNDQERHQLPKVVGSRTWSTRHVKAPPSTIISTGGRTIAYDNNSDEEALKRPNNNGRGGAPAGKQVAKNLQPQSSRVPPRRPSPAQSAVPRRPAAPHTPPRPPLSPPRAAQPPKATAPVIASNNSKSNKAVNPHRQFNGNELPIKARSSDIRERDTAKTAKSGAFDSSLSLDHPAAKAPKITIYNTVPAIISTITTTSVPAVIPEAEEFTDDEYSEQLDEAPIRTKRSDYYDDVHHSGGGADNTVKWDAMTSLSPTNPLAKIELGKELLAPATQQGSAHYERLNCFQYLG